MMDGQPEKACDMNIGEVAGRSVMTIEGLKNDPLGVNLQDAWLQHQVPQCGFCQSGMLMAAYGRLKAGNPSLHGVRPVQHLPVRHLSSV